MLENAVVLKEILLLLCALRGKLKKSELSTFVSQVLRFNVGLL